MRRSLSLIFYSGGTYEDNHTLNQYSVNLAQKNRKKKISDLKYSFIPAQSYESEIEFHEIVDAIAPLGITKFLHLPIDIFIDKIMEREVFTGDIIHLGGGNTFYFLKFLREKKLIGKLLRFVRGGGVLTGLSAGGIMMTPSIATASFPSFDCDLNDEKITKLNALNFVNFDFFPHYKNSIRYDLELSTYSVATKRPLYCTPDGNGIIVDCEKLIFVGRSYLFLDGEKIVINN